MMKIHFWHGFHEPTAQLILERVGGKVKNEEGWLYISVGRKKASTIMRALPDLPWMTLPHTPGHLYTTQHKNFGSR